MIVLSSFCSGIVKLIPVGLPTSSPQPNSRFLRLDGAARLNFNVDAIAFFVRVSSLPARGASEVITLLYKYLKTYCIRLAIYRTISKYISHNR